MCAFRIFNYIFNKKQKLNTKQDGFITIFSFKMTKSVAKKYALISTILTVTGIVMITISGLIYYIDNASLNLELINVM